MPADAPVRFEALRAHSVLTGSVIKALKGDRSIDLNGISGHIGEKSVAWLLNYLSAGREELQREMHFLMSIEVEGDDEEEES